MATGRRRSQHDLDGVLRIKAGHPGRQKSVRELLQVQTFEKAFPLAKLVRISRTMRTLSERMPNTFRESCQISKMVCRRTRHDLFGRV